MTAPSLASAPSQHSAPLLVLLAHGTADPDGQATLEQVRAAVADRARSHRVVLAYADVIAPTAQQVLAGSVGAVVVPLFLTSGYHVQVDAPAATASASGVRLAATLGPDRGVVEALADRVAQLPGPRPARLVLAAAGSSRAQARAEVDLAATRLGAALGIRVEAGFLSGPGPAAGEVLGEVGNSATQRDAVAVASYLLAPGYFARVAARLAEERGVRCTGPIGAHPALIDLILDRFDESQSA